MIAALLLQIESAELLTGGAFRPYHWAPLRVTMRGDARGELVIRTDAGFSLVAPAAAETVVPVLALRVDAPLEIVNRADSREVSTFKRKRLGRGLYQSERLIGATGTADDKTVLFSAGRDWPLEWFEAVDAVVGLDPPGYRAMGGIVAADLADAVAKIEARGKFVTRWFEPVDPNLAMLAPGDGWIGTKKSFATWFTVLYLLACLATLSALALWRPKWSWAAALALGAAGVGVCFAAFPRGTVSVTYRRCVAGAELHVWFARRSQPGVTEIVFPLLVKPIYASPTEAANDRFELHVGRGHSRVTGLSLATPRAFAAVGSLGQYRGDARPLDPMDPWARYFGEKFGRAVAVGELAPGPTVRSPDLAEERELPPLILK